MRRLIPATLIAIGIVVSLIAGYFGYLSSTVPAIQVVNILSSAGSVLSVIGLVIAFVQIWSVRRVAEAAREAAEQTRDRLEFTLTIYDVSRASKLIDEIQAYISSERLELALLRVGDLHELLIRFGQHRIVKQQVDQGKYNSMCKNLGIELNSLRNALQRKPITLNLSALNKHLMTAKTQLSHIEGEIRFTETHYER